MKNWKKAAIIASMIGIAFSSSGCSKNRSKKGQLYIVYYPGGYGSEWLTNFVREYVADVKYGGNVKKVNDSKDYILKADENATFNTNYLTSKTLAPDLIMAGAPDSTTIAQGLVEPMTDLFDSDISYTSADGNQVTTKVREYVNECAYKQFEREQEFDMYGGEKDVYAMPVTTIPLSLVYNEGILKSTTHIPANGAVDPSKLSADKWVNPPETFDELIAFFKDIESSGKNVAPFAWATKNSIWFESMYIQWWAELQGLYESRVAEQGSYYDFWNLESAEVFKQTGIQGALNKVKELLYDESGNYHYSYKNKDNSTIDGTWCQSDFALGNAAVCLTGDFFANEYASQIAESGSTFKMMKLPTITNNLQVSDGAGGTRQMKTVYCNADASCYIPFNAKNKDLAKGFVKYMIEEEQVLRFTEMTGCLRPYNVNKDKMLSRKEWSAYQQSVLDLYYNSDEVIYKFPKTHSDDVSPIYTDEDIRTSFLVGVSYPQVLSRLKNYDGEDIMIKGSINQFKSVYEEAQILYDQPNIGFNEIYYSWIQTQI